MASAQEIAATVLKSFGANVVARHPPMTYGQYASAIGRAPAEYGLAVGKAMHAIGALCILRRVPVAPLFWVRRADDGYRGVFERDALERQYVLESNDIDTMYVVSREYRYTSEDFAGLQRALQKSLASANASTWSPHQVWHLTFVKRPKGSEATYYEQAMCRYRELFNEIKSEKAARK